MRLFRSHRLGICCTALLTCAAGAAAQDAAPAASGSAAASTPVQIAPPPAASAPAVNRFNDVLPAWLRTRGEFRTRLEGVDGLGFDDARRDLYLLSRFRLQATVTPSSWLAFQVQAQDARVAGKTVGPTGAPFRSPIDIRVAAADIGSARAPVAARIGRQELVYGEQRLIGHLGWANAARSFDGVKLTLRGGGFSADVFAASVVRTFVDGFDRSGAGNRFAGVYGTSGRLIPGATVEPYLLWKRDARIRSELGAIDDLQHATAGVRIVGALPARLDYGVEMALQRGSLGSEDVRAWAGHWQLRHATPGRLAPKIIGEYNFASGDDDPADGIRGTFDQLYPTSHDKTGLADQVGWSNIHHVRAGVELTPLRALPLSVSLHSWWLAEPRDALYNIGSAVVARPVDGTGRHVGREIDVQATRALTPQLALAGGYAHITPGAFLEAATPGASYSHPYVMVTYVFLAER